MAEFRDIINKKKTAAEKELEYLNDLIQRKETTEDPSGEEEIKQLSIMQSRQVQYITNLTEALFRIDNKSYGLCRLTGKLIDKARLRAVPHATITLEAKLGINIITK